MTMYSMPSKLKTRIILSAACNSLGKVQSFQNLLFDRKALLDVANSLIHFPNGSAYVVVPRFRQQIHGIRHLCLVIVFKVKKCAKMILSLNWEILEPLLPSTSSLRFYSVFSTNASSRRIANIAKVPVLPCKNARLMGACEHSIPVIIGVQDAMHLFQISF